MSQRKGNLPTFIAHMAVGQTMAQSAAAAGLSIKTAQRRLQEPQVRTAITEAQADLTRHALARLRDIRDQAMDRVSQVLADNEAGWSAHHGPPSLPCVTRRPLTTHGWWKRYPGPKEAPDRRARP